MQQFLGKADVTVSTDGILISKKQQDGRADLIDEALKYNGSLPTNVTPVAPVQRNRQTAPAPTPRPSTPNSIQPPTTVPASQTPGGIKP
jgi:hypothetical protein